MRQSFLFEPGDIAPSLAAKRMGLSPRAFSLALPELQKRGFPYPDPTTGKFDFQAIERWRQSRHGTVAGSPFEADDAEAVVGTRLAALVRG